jgi:hypothetical protein
MKFLSAPDWIFFFVCGVGSKAKKPRERGEGKERAVKKKQTESSRFPRHV